MAAIEQSPSEETITNYIDGAGFRGRRIVDNIQLLLKAMQTPTLKHLNEKFCNGNLRIRCDVRTSATSKLSFICSRFLLCDYEFNLETAKPSTLDDDIVRSCIAIGIGFAQCEEFLASSAILPISRHSYEAAEKRVSKTIKAAAEKSMSKVRERVSERWNWSMVAVAYTEIA